MFLHLLPAGFDGPPKIPRRKENLCPLQMCR
jgi:hypothetical protein